jgi:AcrR family transcriptional regulator
VTEFGPGGTVAARPLRARDSTASRQALLEAAQELFGTLGFERTTVREIGERAGVDAALIARYFGSKADLYVAAVIAERMDDGPLDDYDGLAHIVESLVARVDRHGPGPILQALARSDTPDEIRAAAQARLERRLVEPLVSRMDVDGVDRAPLRAQIAVSAVGMVRRAGVGARGPGGGPGRRGARRPEWIGARWDPVSADGERMRHAPRPGREDPAYGAGVERSIPRRATMASRDTVLRGEVEDLLGARDHWSLQPSSSPGMPSQWCLLAGPEIELSVTVDQGTIVVYVTDRNAEIVLDDVTALAAWLDADEALFLARPSMAAELFDDLVTGRIREWGRLGIHSG